VNLDKTGTMAMIANYGGGSTASYQIQSDGSLSQPTSHHQHIGSSVDPKRQKEPHAHSVNISPDNRFAFVCDLGTDKVNIYAIDPSTGKMTPHEPAFGKVPAGSGPRHLAFHPSGKFVFVNNEMSMTETVFAYDTAKGTLTEVQTVSTLPEADRNQPGLSTAETVAHPNGKIVYVSNRGHDTIACFRCDEATGKLSFIECAPAGVQTPRNFGIDATGKWMITAGQGSNSVAVFAMDQETGRIKPTGQTHEVGAPVCVRFLRN
jgi:6-phosphogluconolactonase